MASSRSTSRWRCMVRHGSATVVRHRRWRSTTPRSSTSPAWVSSTWLVVVSTGWTDWLEQLAAAGVSESAWLCPSATTDPRTVRRDGAKEARSSVNRRRTRFPEPCHQPRRGRWGPRLPREGFNQLANYAADHGKHVAYMLIFNVSGRPLELPTHGGRRLVALSENADEFWASLGCERHDHPVEPDSYQSLFIQPRSL
jgi:hypothetical protein